MQATKQPLPSRSTKKGKKSTRLDIIDYLKGIAVIHFTFGHLVLYWSFESNWIAIPGIIALVMDWAGPSLFISFTVIGTMISIRKKQLQHRTKGMFKNALIKFVYLFIVGEVMNIIIDVLNTVSTGNSMGLWHILGMNMITAVAFAQLFVYLLVKLTRIQKLVLLLGLIVIYPVLLDYCLRGMNFGWGEFSDFNANDMTSLPYILYYLLFHLEAMAPTMAWVITTLTIVLVFDGFVKFYVITNQKEISVRKMMLLKSLYARKLFGLGILLLIFSVVAGGYLITPGIAFSKQLYLFLIEPGIWNFWGIEGLPLIWIRHMPHYLLFNAAILVLVFTSLFFLHDIKNVNLPFKKYLSTFGIYSFSIFVYEHMFALIPIELYDIVSFSIVFLPLIFGLIIIVRKWHEKYKGIGSLEWGLGIWVTKVQTLQMGRP